MERIQSESASRSKLFSALAAADLTTLYTSRAAFWGMKRSIVSASSTLRPRTASTTSRTLRGLIGMSFATARTSIAPLSHLGRFAPGVPPKRTGRCKFPQLVADHVLADVDRHMASAIVHGNGVADELRKDRGVP